jgi:predicted dehydrogenase
MGQIRDNLSYQLHGPCVWNLDFNAFKTWYLTGKKRGTYLKVEFYSSDFFNHSNTANPFSKNIASPNFGRFDRAGNRRIFPACVSLFDEENESMNRRRFLLGSAVSGLASAVEKYRVGIIGCGRMGQYYADVYRTLPDTQIVAIAEWNPDRRRVVGERYGVKALYRDAESMLKDVVPDIAAVITPSKFMKDAVIACAEAGVKGVSTDKPIAARLSDADAMVEICRKRRVVFAGGNLQRAKWEVQQAARRIKAGEFGKLTGAAVHAFGGEISGGGCQHMSVLRLFAGEVDEVMAWGSPPEAMAREDDHGLVINGRFIMQNGLPCQVFGSKTPNSGVDVWTETSLIRWDWAVPRIFEGRDSRGARREIHPHFPPFPWRDVIEKAGLRAGDDYLVASIRSFLDAVRTGSELWISGHDLRQALEIAIAAKLSAQLGNAPVKLPLRDRSLTLYPSPYRWLGGDATGRPQSAEEAAGKRL